MSPGRVKNDVGVVEGSTSNVIPAELWSSIEQSNLDHFRLHWKPQLLAAKQTAEAAIARGENVKPVEDAHWDWGKKVYRSTTAPFEFKDFALECRGMTEGLMQLELVRHRSRLAPIGRHIVYVDFVSVAPWNRVSITRTPRYRAIGSIFIAQAIGESLDEGFGGKVGLHALPSAAEWYRTKLRMTSLGADSSYHNLEYFEYSDKDANAFLDSVTK